MPAQTSGNRYLAVQSVSKYAYRRAGRSIAEGGQTYATEAKG